MKHHAVFHRRQVQAPRRGELGQAIEVPLMRRKCSASPRGSVECFQGSVMARVCEALGTAVHGRGRKSMKRGLAAIVAPAPDAIVDASGTDRRDFEESDMTAKTTLVLGGTGKTGRRIVEQLAARNVPVRFGSRSAQPAFDWENPDTWAAALRERRRGLHLLLSRSGGTGRDRRDPGVHGLAVRSGVRDSCCCPAAANPRRSAAKRSSSAQAPSGRCSAAAGSTRTSARTTSSTRSSPVRSRCPRETSASRSSMPTTSPMPPWRR